jgi:5-formyltetrahydrofolate cyclo-ligase
MDSERRDNKERVREQLLAKRGELSDATQQRAAREVCRRLSDWGPAQEADAVAGYLPFDNEVDVTDLLDRKLEGGARVGLPRVEDDEQMHFVPVDSLQAVEEGAFGILEPTGASVAVTRFDFFLVPGVGFDRGGRRIGMGWGYYDRILAERAAADAGRPRFVGVCHDFQLVDGEIPVEAHDVRMDAVVTPGELIASTNPSDDERSNQRHSQHDG